MKKWIVGSVVLLLVAGIIFTWRAATTGGRLRVRVVDNEQVPVGGVMLRPYMMVGADSSHHNWRSNEFGVGWMKAKTDADGFAILDYPRWLTKEVAAAELLLAVDHENFPSQNTSVPVPAPLWMGDSLWEKARHGLGRLLGKGGEAEVIRLARTAVIVATGFLEGEKEKEVEVYPRTIVPGGFGPISWHREGKRLVTTTIPSAARMELQLVHRGGDGRFYFSELYTVLAGAGTSNYVHLPLKPGVHVASDG